MQTLSLSPYYEFIIDPPGHGRIGDHYFHAYCPSVCPKTSKSSNNHCRPGLWAGRVDHWWLLSCYYFISDGKLICLSPQCVKTSSYLLTAMDRTSDPCDDFFQFACGSWNRKHVIPEDRSSISTFEVLADQLQIILKGEWAINLIQDCKLMRVSE